MAPTKKGGQHLSATLIERIEKHLGEMDIDREAASVYEPPMPFFTLRGFLDSVFSVLLAYSFLIVMKHIVTLIRLGCAASEIADHGMMSTALGMIKGSGAPPYSLSLGEILPQLQSLPTWATGTSTSYWNSLLETAWLIANDLTFWQETMIVWILVVMALMFIDDYARARIITWLSPCRSISRVSVDISIMFFFTLSFALIHEGSIFYLLSLFAAYGLGIVWADIAFADAKNWEKQEQEFAEKHDGFKIPKGSNKHAAMVSGVDAWKIYRDRLQYVASSQMWACLALLGFMIVLMSFIKGQQTDFQAKLMWIVNAPLLFGLHVLIELRRFRKEVQLSSGERDDDETELEYPLKTMGPIFACVRKRLL